MPVATVSMRMLYAADPGDRLFLAGEACSPEDYSTAYGAYSTGLAAAEQARPFGAAFDLVDRYR